MTDLLDRKPRQLSGGQRQRVAMGRAIVREPAAFLMDEPLSNLDAKLRVEMRGEITSLQRRIGTPTLYVTHDQTEAMTMGDRVAILRDGVLEQLGTPAELYDRPSNMFVASFIGSPAMNLIEARCEAVDGRPRLRIGDSVLNVPDAVARAMRRACPSTRAATSASGSGPRTSSRPRARTEPRDDRGRGDPGRVARFGAVRLLPDGRHPCEPGDRRR